MYVPSQCHSIQVRHRQRTTHITVRLMHNLRHPKGGGKEQHEKTERGPESPAHGCIERGEADEQPGMEAGDVVLVLQADVHGTFTRRGADIVIILMMMVVYEVVKELLKVGVHSDVEVTASDWSTQPCGRAGFEQQEKTSESTQRCTNHQ